MVLKFIFFSILGYIILRWVLKKAVVMLFHSVGQQLQQEMERKEQERYDFEKDGIRIKKPARRPEKDDYTDYEEVK